MNYIMMSYAWSRQLPERQEIDLPELFRVAGRLGFKSMNMVTLYNRDPREIRQIADDFDISLVMYTFAFDVCGWGCDKSDRELHDIFARELDAAEILGVSKVMLLPNGKPGVSRLKNREDAIARLPKFIPLATARGITPLIENFPNLDGPFLTAEDLRAAAAGVPGLKLIFDSGNCLIAGENPGAVFQAVAKDVEHVHFADFIEHLPGYKADRPALDGRMYTGCAIGAGAVDYPALLPLIKRSGFNSHIEIEYNGNEYPAEEGIRRALEYLRGLEKSTDIN